MEKNESRIIAMVFPIPYVKVGLWALIYFELYSSSKVT